MYEVVSIFQREEVGIDENEIFDYFRIVSNSLEDRDRKEILDAVRYAIAEIEKDTHYALVGKDVDLYYYEIRKEDVLPFAPCSILSLSVDGEIAAISEYFTSGRYPTCKKDAKDVSVLISAGFDTIPSDWQELALRLAAIKLDTKGGEESDKQEDILKEIQRRKRGQFLIC